MSQLDLLRFCNKRDERSYLREPFSIGLHTFATNGQIIVRVPRIDGIPDGTHKAAEMVSNLFAKMVSRFHPIPHHVRPKQKGCYHCQGLGNVKTCYECDGEGTVWFNNDYNTYQFECNTCDGLASIPSSEGDACELCYGKGKVHDRMSHVRIGKAAIASRLLHLITDLPGVQIQQPTEEMGPVAYRFAGGDGFVMPMRV